MNKKLIKAQMLSENLFPVVGIGASAGGLDAFKELIKAIPGDSGMAYIIIQHLSAEYESILPEILQKQTTIPVLEITDNIKVMPDHIYIIPSNKILTANDGVLQLDQRIKGEKLNAIDVFFTSLAEIHQGHAIGVILSGTGKDGTVGLKTIKDAGGITIVQDETSAAYYGMPQSAIDAEVVDFILSPREIPTHLKELVRTAKIIPSDFTISGDLREDEIFKQILALIRIKRGVDFTYYKQTTVRRRILRRKVLNRIQNLQEYYTLLIENKVEQDLLFKDLLIPVTAFFRDAGTFTILCREILPLVVKEKTKGEPIRIWIAGCSTGEEAYSMAICLQEYLNDTKPGHRVQIFATDISEPVIAKARSGIYKKQDMAGVSESRIQQFFTKSNGGYQINKEIRDMCVFACQNFLIDPPFARIDIVSCRNVLIYMESYLQKKALTTFHYALNKKGFLLLGKSESTSQSSQQFEVFNLRDKIYTRKAVAVKNGHVAQEENDKYTNRKDNKSIIAETKKDDYQKAADEALLSKYASAGVIVNEQLDILQFRESTGAYLEAAPGKASLNILKMAKEGLSFELRNALHKAALGKELVRKEGITIENGKRQVNIEVIPLRNTIDPYFLVLFSDTPVNHVKEEKAINKKGEKKQDPDLLQIEQLKTELSEAREDMRSITEDQESAYEEVQSANEELRSSNEEMQSLYEELETTKEEIQSAYEELSTLNLELIERNEQLVHSRKYAEAVVTTIHEPFIILTGELRIKNVNKAFYEMFRVTEQQTEGKLFFEWSDGLWNDAGLREKLYKILPEHTQFENLEVTIISKEKAESYFSLNARQLINENSDEQLILLAIHDITEKKELEKSQKTFLKKLEEQVAAQTKELLEANVNLHNSNEDLLQFASIASHDLQEPLRKIRTFTLVFIKEFGKNVPDGGQEVINKIKTSAERMSQLIKEVLEYSKLTHSAREFVQTDLDAVIKNVLKDLDLLISDSHASIDYSVALPVIAAIPIQINQLFYNLLTNAFKFYKAGEPPQLSITSQILSQEEAKKIAGLSEHLAYVEIIFTDNGIGFEQQFGDQIFQIFERLNSVEKYEGTGIGLALCKKIVENHHGQIFARSDEKDGARFHVILPVDQL